MWFKGFDHVFQNTYFSKRLSQEAFDLLIYALFTDKLYLHRCTLRSETIFTIESPLKMMKNDFYFTLKALFVLKIFKFSS